MRRVIGEPLMSAMIVTLGLASLLRGLAYLFGRTDVRRFPDDGLADLSVTIGSVRVASVYAWSMVICLACVVTLMSFFRFSQMGLALRAAADDQYAATSMGIRPASACSELGALRGRRRRRPRSTAPTSWWSTAVRWPASPLESASTRAARPVSGSTQAAVAARARPGSAREPEHPIDRSWRACPGSAETEPPGADLTERRRNRARPGTRPGYGSVTEL